MSYILVIVESPAKCRKIEGFLGTGYKCVASFGHLRELTSLKNINIDNDFECKYDIVNDTKKKKHIQTLRSQVKESIEVLLATDDDREGEAIAWHICMLFGLSPLTTKRIIFHEITERAILNAVNSPIHINMNMVSAQRARQILDLLVGFKISPKLWENVVKRNNNSLSAGRCQTPALRIIYDNQKDVNENPGDKVYNTTGYFTSKCIPFELNKHHTDNEIMYSFLEDTSDFSHIFSRSDKTRTYKHPPLPLTTSRLQQNASNEMRCSPKETMSICQKLYEGGYITYMRTDSKKYCKEFVDSAKQYIVQTYNSERYIHQEIDDLVNDGSTEKTSNKHTDTDNEKQSLAQEAHEAIRPTKLTLLKLPEDMNPKEHKMYKLIRDTSLESCMSSSEYWTVHCSIKGAQETKYVHRSELIEFHGWEIVGQCTKSSAKLSDEERKEQIHHYLFSQEVDSNIHFVKVSSVVTLKNCKQHYTEAKLVQLLEEHGIGRPSTYSSLVDKIQERGYVRKQDVNGTKITCVDFELDDAFNITEHEHSREFGREKNKLVIQPLGSIVIEFLLSHFEVIFNYDYTRQMEDQLDNINKGKQLLSVVCRNCLDEIDKVCGTIKGEKVEIKIDDYHTYIIGKYGPVIRYIDPTDKNGKVQFKSVNPNMTIDLKKLERTEYSLEEILAEETDDLSCLGTYQGHNVIIKKGKFGLFARWGDNTTSLKKLGNRPVKNIGLEEVIEEIEGTQKSGGIVRDLNTHLSIRTGKYGDYLFYKKPPMKKPMFLKLHGFDEDYRNCEPIVLIEWIKEKYNVDT